MTGIDPCLGILGGLNEDLMDLPAAPASAHSALNSTLGDKTPLLFICTKKNGLKQNEIMTKYLTN